MSNLTRTRSAEKGGTGAGFEHSNGPSERGHDRVVENLEKLGYKQELVRVSQTPLDTKSSPYLHTTRLEDYSTHYLVGSFHWNTFTPKFS